MTEPTISELWDYCRQLEKRIDTLEIETGHKPKPGYERRTFGDLKKGDVIDHGKPLTVNHISLQNNPKFLFVSFEETGGLTGPFHVDDIADVLMPT